MPTVGQRLTDRQDPPTAQVLSRWLGAKGYKRWAQIRAFIDSNYPGVFGPEWMNYGTRHGWALRFRKSKSFCTLIPEYHQAKIQIVFGADERKKAAPLLGQLTPAMRQAYLSAPTFHDGKWMTVGPDSDDALADVQRLLAVKRRPRTATR